MAMDEDTQRHINSLTKALAAFQLIEDFLKLYIQYSLKLAAVHLTGKMAFFFDADEYQEAPLGKLLIPTMIIVWYKLRGEDSLRAWQDPEQN